MRGKWLVVIAVASLALNAAVVGTFVYQRYADHGSRRHQRLPGLDRTVMEHLRGLREQSAPAMESLGAEMAAARGALMQLTAVTPVDGKKVDSLCAEIGRIHARMARQGFEMSRRVMEVLPPDARQRYIEMLENSPEPGRGPGARHMRRMMRHMGPGEESPAEPPPGGMPPEPPGTGR